jgi:hypothetical protein
MIRKHRAQVTVDGDLYLMDYISVAEFDGEEWNLEIFKNYQGMLEKIDAFRSIGPATLPSRIDHAIQHHMMHDVIPCAVVEVTTDMVKI